MAYGYGLDLLRHAVAQTFGNFSNALRIVWPLLVLVLVLQLVYAPALFRGVHITPQGSVGIPGNLVATGLMLGLAIAAAGLWAAVAWHRFVLREEYPRSVLPAWHGAEILRYLLLTLVIGIILVSVALAIFIPINAIGGSSGGLALILGLIGGLAVFWIAVRIGLILPAAALGEKLTLAESWRATAPVSFQLLIPFIVISVVVNIVQAFIFSMFSAPTLLTGIAMNGTSPAIEMVNPVGQLLLTGVYLVQTLLVLSLYTSLYGNLIEGRELN